MKNAKKMSRIHLGSIVVALMIDLYIFVHVLVEHSGKTGFSQILYPILLAISILIWLMQGQIESVFFKYIVLMGMILGWHWICAPVSRIDVLTLCATTGVPLFILAVLHYKTERVLFYTMLFSVVFIPGLPSYLARYTNQGEMTMGLGYAILPVIVAGIVYFYYYRNDHQDNLWVCIVPLFYLLQLFYHGLRGPIVSVVFIVFLIGFVKVYIGDKKRVLNHRYLLLCLIIGICVVYFLDDILAVMADWFLQYDIKTYFVLKTIRLLNRGDISNGRMEIWERAWDGFKEHPILGNGFDSFEHFTGICYPHNFIMQALFDGGLLFFVPLSLFIVYGYKKVLKYGTRDQIIMLIFISGFCVIYPLISTDMYENFYLWTLIGFLLGQPKYSQIVHMGGTSKW